MKLNFRPQKRLYFERYNQSYSPQVHSPIKLITPWDVSDNLNIKKTDYNLSYCQSNDDKSKMTNIPSLNLLQKNYFRLNNSSNSV